MPQVSSQIRSTNWLQIRRWWCFHLNAVWIRPWKNNKGPCWKVRVMRTHKPQPLAHGICELPKTLLMLGSFFLLRWCALHTQQLSMLLRQHLQLGSLKYWSWNKCISLPLQVKKNPWLVGQTMRSVKKKQIDRRFYHFFPADSPSSDLNSMVVSGSHKCVIICYLPPMNGTRKLHWRIIGTALQIFGPPTAKRPTQPPGRNFCSENSPHKQMDLRIPWGVF